MKRSKIGRLLRGAWKRYRSTGLSSWNRAWMRRANPPTFISMAGVVLGAGAALSLVGVSQAQLARVGSRDLFAYPWFDAGGGLVVAALVVGAAATAAIAAQSAARRTTPLVIETNCGVYCLETRPEETRKLRVCVYNAEAADLYDVRVRLLGGSVRATDFLRFRGDESWGSTQSRTGVTVPGFHHRYFEIAEWDWGSKEVLLGFTDRSLAERNKVSLPEPTPVKTAGEPPRPVFVMLMAEARRVTDDTFVAPAYANFEFKDFGGGPVLKLLAGAEPLYDGPTTPEERAILP